MGLMDKVKAQATQIAEKAQEAGKAGQAKIESVQAKRKADSLLRELGRLVYLADTGRADAAPTRRAELIEELRAQEAESGPFLAEDDEPAAPVPTTVSTYEPATSNPAPSPSPSSVPSEPGVPQAGPAEGAEPAPGGLPRSNFGGSSL